MDITPPDNISYGTVVWRVGVDVNDTDDLGSKPDLVPPTGYVTFVSSVGKLLNPTATPDPLTVLRYPIIGVIDEEGYLCTPDPNNRTPDFPKGVPAYRGVELIATDDPDLNPLNPVYNVEYKLKGPDGVVLAYPQPHKIAVLTGEIVDLTDFIPPDNAQTIGLPQATALVARAEAAAQSAEAQAAAAEASAGLAADALVDSAAFVGDEIATPGTPAEVAVTANQLAGLTTDGDPRKEAVDALIAAVPSAGNIQATARKMADDFGDVTLQFLGDSTIAQWLPTLLARLATMYPHRSIRTYTWNDTTKVYGSAVTVATGTGSTWINVWDGSKGGTVEEFAYIDAGKKFESTQPDCFVIGYGLNHGNTATASARFNYRIEMQRLASVVKASCPTADLLLIAQNPRIDAGYQTDLATNRAQQVRSVAAEMGAAYAGATEAFLAVTTASFLESDGIHPNTAGQSLYAAVLAPLFAVQQNMQPSTRVASPLSTPGSEVGVNCDFAAFPGSLTGWTLVNASVAKNTSIFESPNGYAVELTATASAQSRMEQQLPVNRVKGKWATVAARMWIPAGMSNVTGRTEISTTGGATPIAIQQSPGTQATTRDCWIWEYTSAFIPADSSTVKVKVIAGATSDPTAKVIVDRVFIGIGTQPHDVVSRTALPATSAPASQDGLTAGQMVPSRDLMNSNVVSHASGTLALAYFTADKTETINTLTAYTGTVAAVATPTLCRMGVYEIDASGNGTLVASTPSDTALFAATNTAYAKALSAPLSKVAGRRYATAILVVSPSTMPNFHGPLAVATPAASVVAQLAPATIGRITAQTDLPASFTAVSAIGYQQRAHMLLS